MPQQPASADPGRDGLPDWEPVITRPDWMTEEEREAWLDALAGEDEPPDPEEYPDPDGAPPPGEDELTAEEIAGIGEAVEAEARAAAQAAASGTAGALGAIAALGGRRGPGPAGVGGGLPWGVRQPGGRVRDRAGAGCAARLPGPGDARRCGRRAGRHLRRRFG